jgi:hypothetical protein
MDREPTLKEIAEELKRAYYQRLHESLARKKQGQSKRI